MRTKKLNVLILGYGSREHALAWKIRQSPRADRIFVAPGNAGTAEIATNVPISDEDIPALVVFARQNQIDLTVVGTNDPLALGVVDAFQAAGLPIFGPRQAAARLESSKAFAKAFMQRHSIPRLMLPSPIMKQPWLTWQHSQTAVWSSKSAAWAKWGWA
jgi:phosphoribosylamine---glycine ligase